MVARFERWHRFGAWLALGGLVFQIIASAAHSAAHLDHLIGPLHASDRTQLAAEFYRQPAAPAGIPAAPHEDSCPLDLGLLVSSTFVAADPGQFPVLLAPEPASLEAANPVFVLAVRRHLLPVARAPPAIETVA